MLMRQSGLLHSAAVKVRGHAPLATCSLTVKQGQPLNSMLYNVNVLMPMNCQVDGINVLALWPLSVLTCPAAECQTKRAQS
jgi:hypothetical protein